MILLIWKYYCFITSIIVLFSKLIKIPTALFWCHALHCVHSIRHQFDHFISNAFAIFLYLLISESVFQLKLLYWFQTYCPDLHARDEHRSLSDYLKLTQNSEFHCCVWQDQCIFWSMSESSSKYVSICWGMNTI